MTHEDLVKRSVKWLRNSEQCGVVLAETGGSGWEIPDAIGWKHGGHHSILIECKTSRSDFKRDLKKTARLTAGLGQRKFYFAPKGLLKVEEIPDKWGLLEVCGKIVKRTKNVEIEQYNFQIAWKEMHLFYSALRKMELGIPLDRFHKLTESGKRIAT